MAPGSVEELREQVIDLNRALADLIRFGEAPPRTLGSLRQMVTETLAVTSPRYLERYVDKP